jgi:hypothetical protein
MKTSNLFLFCTLLGLPQPPAPNFAEAGAFASATNEFAAQKTSLFATDVASASFKLLLC